MIVRGSGMLGDIYFGNDALGAWYFNVDGKPPGRDSEGIDRSVAPFKLPPTADSESDGPV